MREIAAETWCFLLWLSSTAVHSFHQPARATAFVMVARPPSVFNGFSADGGGRRRWLESRADPLSCPRLSADDTAQADGLTTGPGEIQTNGSPGGMLRDSDLFIPAPSLTKIAPGDMSALEDSPFFRRIMDGAEGGEPDLRHFEALERVVLMANGNLQRFISSYYNAVVTVDVKRCEELRPSLYERDVTLTVLGQEFCVAKSVVVLHSPVSREAVKTGVIGIGQLFRALDILPKFELLRAGRKSVKPAADGDVQGLAAKSGPPSKGGKLWRLYDLKSRELSCRIHEEFTADFLELEDK